MSQTFTSDAGGVQIAYDDVGGGRPVVLVHGFASDRRGTWRAAGWDDALADAGYRVLALDVRGHGESDAPHDPAAYEPAVVAGDVVGLLDHCGIDEADLVGYSMGARLSMHLLVDHPDRFGAVVLAGVGERTLREERYSAAIADALAADDPDDVSDPTAREFRAFAARRGNDLTALAAFRRAPQAGLTMDPARLASVVAPVLVVAGGEDDLVGDPGPLADAIPGATAVVIPGRDHLSAVDDPRHRAAVRSFLDRARRD
ncbi:MAG: alpha/beta fold hydrolase [Haloarculaceae archaeon]